MKLIGKCPNIISDRWGEEHLCNYGGYIIRQRGLFTKDSGIDTEGCLVECRRCHHIYFLFPPIKLPKTVLEVASEKRTPLGDVGQA